MLNWRQWLIRLYPAGWRERYAAEFQAMLAQMEFSGREVMDLVRGALDAHLHPELYTYGRWPVKSTLLRIAGVGALLSAVVLLLALFSSNFIAESESEFLLLFAPVALLPAVFALHHLIRPAAPRLSQWIAIIGAAGMGMFLCLTVLTILPLPVVNDFLLALTPLWQALVLCTGLWLLLVAGLGWWTRVLPLPLAVVAILNGLSWFGVMVGAMLSSTNPAVIRAFNPLWGIILLAWLGSHLLWTIGLGVWLLFRPGNLPNSPGLSTTVY